MFCEIGAGCRFDAIGAFSKKDLIEIKGYDLILGKNLVDLRRQDGLFYLAYECAFP